MEDGLLLAVTVLLHIENGGIVDTSAGRLFSLRGDGIAGLLVQSNGVKVFLFGQGEGDQIDDGCLAVHVAKVKPLLLVYEAFLESVLSLSLFQKE